jgi:hypothetical protein
MLTPDERAFVHDALLNAVRYQQNPRGTIAVYMEKRLADLLEGEAPAIVVARAIKLCLDDGRNADPPALVSLLEFVSGLDMRIPPLIERLKQPPVAGGPTPADRFTDSLLFANQPFLERTKTRAALRGLLQNKPRQPFVVINGLSKLGKSYTADFIDHVLLEGDDPEACVVRVVPETGSSIGPSELARDLVARMGGDRATEPKKDTNSDRWCEELVSWITEPGIKEQKTWWIVLDGFNKNELRADTRLLIAKLATRITSAKPRRFFRLILLDFDHTALLVTPGLINVHDVQPIPKSVVNAFLSDVFAQANGIDVPALYAKVTDGLSDPITELPVLAKRLGSLIDGASA